LPAKLLKAFENTPLEFNDEAEDPLVTDNPDALAERTDVLEFITNNEEDSTDVGPELPTTTRPPLSVTKTSPCETLTLPTNDELPYTVNDTFRTDGCPIETAVGRTLTVLPINNCP
jgi:hypothetical protein